MMKRVLLAALLIAASVCAGWYAHSAREKVKMRNLKATDPELAALWENFVGNDVRPHGSLDAKTRHLILQAGHVAAQSPNEYRLVLAAALDDGVSPVEAKEALYQTIPYVGMAKAYDFVLAANEVMAEKGIQLPLEGQSRTTPQNRLEKGLAAQKEIFGSHIDEMRASAPRGSETYSGLPFGQLFRRLLYPRRFGFENPRTADFCNADFAWRR